MAEAEIKSDPVAEGLENGGVDGENARGVATSDTTAPTTAIDTKETDVTNDKQYTDDKPAAKQDDADMAEEAAKEEDIMNEETATAPSDIADQGVDAQVSAGNSKARRKSGGVPEHKTKKLNKKASKAKMTHIDAKPGDYFFVRLKGYPQWPAIICDDSMLPTPLTKSRPVSAAGTDGTYRTDYQDGGRRAKDRSFPVMYLYTNEFGWVANTDLIDLDFDTVADISPAVRKDLYAAHQLAAEKHDLDYFKELLTDFMETRAAELQAKEDAKAEKKTKKTKRQSKAAVEEDEDVDMADVAAESDSKGAESAGDKPKKGKKRKAEDDEVTDSAKKPKTVLKLTNTTKSTSTPKTPKDQSASKAKPKAKKAAPKAKEPVVTAPKEPELTPEEKRVKKEKEILFLRHRLQKGLLTKDQGPKEDEMKSMSEFITKLEGYADLEVSIIRTTKINKVLKAILKLGTIPKEEEFNFKTRSQALLDKWNKLLAVDQDVPTPTATNGVKQVAKPDQTEANGVKESANDETTEEKAQEDAASGTTKSEEPSTAEPTVAEATA